MIKSFLKKIISALGIDKSKLFMDFMEKRKDRILKERKDNFKKYGQECLERAKSAFDSLDIDFWLDYGTLLGAYREKDFIEHDLDLDIGLYYENRSDKLEEALTSRGLKKVREFRADGKIVEETYTFNGADLDVFYYFYDQEKLWAYFFYYDDIKETKTINKDNKVLTTGWKAKKTTLTNRGLGKLKFKDIEYTVPNHPEKYLKENYGDSFMIKQKNWNYVNSQTNVENVKFDEVLCVSYAQEE